MSRLDIDSDDVTDVEDIGGVTAPPSRRGVWCRMFGEDGFEGMNGSTAVGSSESTSVLYSSRARSLGGSQ